MWLERLKTGLLVLGLTGLIWFFANQADMDTTKVLLTVQVPPGSGDLVVLRSEPAILEFEVEVRAPRAVIRDVNNETQARPWRRPYTIDKNTATGLQSFDAADVVRQLDVVQQRGLTVVSVEPATFTLDIDRMVPRQLRVQPQFGDLLVDTLDVRPQQVQVSMPKRMADAYTSDVLPVDMTRYVSDATQTDRNMRQLVPLAWFDAVPEARFVRFDPTEVQVRFRLRGQLIEQSFRGVQVMFQFPPDMQRQYYAEEQNEVDFRPDIRIRGPKQVVENLKPEDIRLYVEVQPADQTKVDVITRQVEADLPEGVTFVGPRPEVRFKLKKREAAG